MDVDEKMTILGHLKELRHRLIRCVIAVAATSAICLIFAPQLFDILILPSGGIELVYIEMTEMLGTYMRVSLMGGIAVAMPFLVYQLIMFVSPALTRREKKYVFIVLPWIALMFVSGVVFAYYILIPPAVQFLGSFGSDIATPQIKIGNYIGLVTRMLLAVGLVFELPVITTLLARLGVISPQWLSSRRKAAFIFAFVLGAVITPTFDPINQSFVAVPLIILYEMSILLARLVYRGRSQPVAALEPAAETGK